MRFIPGKEYSRKEIADGLGVSDDMHAVLVSQGRAIAIVVTDSGFNPFNRRQYKNQLTDDKFTMHGEYDGRGRTLERPDPLPLFFLHTGGGGYRYEGAVRYVSQIDWAGEPWREFVRLPED